MQIRAQIGMVLNLDKCIGCHTCSVTCKNVWTSRQGVEYAWFNNVETKPGVGYPNDWENQKRWNGGWEAETLDDGATFDPPELEFFYEGSIQNGIGYEVEGFATIE